VGTGEPRPAHAWDAMMETGHLALAMPNESFQ
jgi:hypothetical protein